MKRVLTRLVLKLAFITTHVAFDSHLCHPNSLEGRFRQDGLFCGERYFLLSNVSNTFTLFEMKQRKFPSLWKIPLSGKQSYQVLPSGQKFALFAKQIQNCFFSVPNFTSFTTKAIRCLMQHWKYGFKIIEVKTCFAY